MKKLITLLCIAAMVLSLAACTGGKSGENGGGSGGAETENKYNINYDSTDVQDMSSDKAESQVLSDVVENWLGGNTMFMVGQDQGAYTYEDFAKKIGVDATTYNKDETGKRVYTWVASDDSTAKLAAFFEENDGKWQLSAIGSTNLI